MCLTFRIGPPNPEDSPEETLESPEEVWASQGASVTRVRMGRKRISKRAAQHWSNFRRLVYVYPIMYGLEQSWTEGV